MILCICKDGVLRCCTWVSEVKRLNLIKTLPLQQILQKDAAAIHSRASMLEAQETVLWCYWNLMDNVRT